MVRSGEWLSRGWTLVRPYLVTHALIALVVAVLSALTVGILAGPLTCGWFMILLRQRRDSTYEPQFGDLWKGFEVFGQSFLAWLIIAIAAAVAGGVVGGVASIIEAVPVVGQLLAPMTGAVLAVCVMVVFLYVFPLVADRRMDFWPAIQLSAETTAPEFLPFAGFALILYVLSAIGAALCGLGALITGPVVMAAIAVSYGDVLRDFAAPSEELIGPPGADYPPTQQRPVQE